MPRYLSARAVASKGYAFIQKKLQRLGIRLAAALREHGMVEHTVWIEEEADINTS